MQHIRLIGLVLVLVLAGSNVAVAQEGSVMRAAPSVTPLQTTATSHPWLAWAPLGNGYVEEEFQFSGEAGIYNYASAPPPPWDLTLQEQQPFTSRMIVRRPADPAALNGTVVVAWLNVTAGYDVDIEWNTVAQYLQRSGYTFVGVSAQAAGVAALKRWDAQRYGALNIVDDGQSYDIFTQAAQALRQPTHRSWAACLSSRLSERACRRAPCGWCRTSMPSIPWCTFTTASLYIVEARHAANPGCRRIFRSGDGPDQH